MGDAVVNRSVEPDGTVVVELRGELDLAINEALRLLLVETAATVRPPAIVVDMLHVSFVDSTGIGALAAGYRAARGYCAASSPRYSNASGSTVRWNAAGSGRRWRAAGTTHRTWWPGWCTTPCCCSRCSSRSGSGEPTRCPS